MWSRRLPAGWFPTSAWWREDSVVIGRVSVGGRGCVHAWISSAASGNVAGLARRRRRSESFSQGLDLMNQAIGMKVIELGELEGNGRRAVSQ